MGQTDRQTDTRTDRNIAYVNAVHHNEVFGRLGNESSRDHRKCVVVLLMAKLGVQMAYCMLLVEWSLPEKSNQLLLLFLILLTTA